MIDYKIFKKINDLAGHNKSLDNFFIIGTRYIIWLLVFASFIMGLFNLLAGNKILLFTAIFSATGIFLINHIIGFFYFRPRPCAIHKVNQLIHHLVTKKSFPSDHSAISFSLAASIYFFNPFVGIVSYILAVWVATARVYIGVHYPLDVLFGAILGVMAAIITNGILII